MQTCCCEILLNFLCDKIGHYVPERIKKTNKPICAALKNVKCEWIWGLDYPTAPRYDS